MTKEIFFGFFLFFLLALNNFPLHLFGRFAYATLAAAYSFGFARPTKESAIALLNNRMDGWMGGFLDSGFNHPNPTSGYADYASAKESTATQSLFDNAL